MDPKVTERIENLKKKLQARALSKDYDFMTDAYGYTCSIENLERMLEKYLKEIDALLEEYELGMEAGLGFRKEAAEILYDAAMERREFKWALRVKRKYYF